MARTYESARSLVKKAAKLVNTTLAEEEMKPLIAFIQETDDEEDPYTPSDLLDIIRDLTVDTMAMGADTGFSDRNQDIWEAVRTILDCVPDSTLLHIFCTSQYGELEDKFNAIFKILGIELKTK